MEDSFYVLLKINRFNKEVNIVKKEELKTKEIEKVYKKLDLMDQKRNIVPKENSYHEFTRYDMTKKNRSIDATGARLGNNYYGKLF